MGVMMELPEKVNDSFCKIGDEGKVMMGTSPLSSQQLMVSPAPIISCSTSISS